MDLAKEFSKRFCPHRGLGRENTISAISSGIIGKSFLVEFDVQLYNQELHLGHPPKVNKLSTLNDALQLFINFKSIPKIDIKLNEHDQYEAIGLLVAKLNDWSPRFALVNIAGELEVTQFMSAELELVSKTSSNIMLNIDPCQRYGGIEHSTLAKYLNKLARKPFSISPNLDDDLQMAIETAQEFNIKHLHFWSYFDKQYDKQMLYSVMQTTLDNNLEPYFDIRLDNIMG